MSLKVRELLLAESEWDKTEEGGEIQSVRETPPAIVSFEDGGRGSESRNVGSGPKLEMVLRWQLARK